jgi:hypothetical protein
MQHPGCLFVDFGGLIAVIGLLRPVVTIDAEE